MSSFNRTNSHTRTSHCQHGHKVKKQKEKHASCRRRQFLPCNRLFNQGGGMGLHEDTRKACKRCSAVWGNRLFHQGG